MKKNKIVYTIAFLCIIFSPSFTCIHDDDDEHHYRIRFVNKSEQAVYINRYPNRKECINYPEIYKVLPGKTNTEALTNRMPWEYVFDTNQIPPLATITVFVFDAELLETNPTFVEEALLVSYDLSLYDLQRLNWTLSYPPTDNMKTIMGISEK